MRRLRANVYVEGQWYGPAHGAVVSDEVAAKIDPDLFEPEPEPVKPAEKPKPPPAKVASTAKKK